MKKNTANQILDTATSLFAVFGFEKVTIKQLALAATSNPAAISYYFGGKENLYREVLECQFSPALQALREEDVSCRLTAIEQLLAYVTVITDIQHKQPCLAALWRYEMHRYAASQKRSIIEEYTLQLHQHFVSALCHGISQKEFHSSLDPHNTARVLLEIMHAPYIPASLLQEKPLSDIDVCKNYSFKAVHYCLQGILRDGPPLANRNEMVAGDPLQHKFYRLLAKP